MPPSERLSAWDFARFGALAIVIALFLFISAKAGMRGLGAIAFVNAGVLAIMRRIPLGTEGGEPSAYITGVPAVLLSLLMGLIGIAMVAQPELALALLGWDAK